MRAYAHDADTQSFGGEAAAALNVDPARVFKTLLAQIDGSAAGSGLAVAIVPVSGMLDLKTLAATLGVKKAVMADPGAAQRSTGYVVGGISPIGQRKSLPTVLDESATRYESVLVSGGRRGLDLELSASDLVAITGAVYAAISRER
ncbi:Cys-tRNA(Pro) deacylase [soil metagenome]